MVLMLMVLAMLGDINNAKQDSAGLKMPIPIPSNTNTNAKQDSAGSNNSVGCCHHWIWRKGQTTGPSLRVFILSFMIILEEPICKHGFSRGGIA